MIRIRLAGLLLLLTCACAVSLGASPAIGSSGSAVYLQALNSDKLVQKGLTGSGTVVAVIDTGISEVPELSGSVIHEVNLSGYPSAGDQYGHGTFVAALIHRAAPDTKFVSVKLSGPNGAVDMSQVLAALQWVVSHKETYGIDVVNLSFGSNSKQSYHVSPLNFAVERAWHAGLAVVVSAGNLGNASGTVTKPGDDPFVITVGASDDRGTASISDDTTPDFTSRGPTQDGLLKPDVVAPGARIVSARVPGSTIDQNYPAARMSDTEFRGSGSSFAAPLVSGVVAQLLQADPSLTPDQVKDALRSTARSIDGDATAQGRGIVDALAARNFAKREAKQGAARSNGSGTLDEDRGANRVVVLGIEVTGDLTGQLALFDKAEYLSSEWDARQWGASQWGARQWGSAEWDARQWGASQWGASEWWASQWG